MNPIILNTPNIIQFGFKATFNLELNRITFDISGLTTFAPGNAGNVIGIYFEVYDASGLQVATPNFANPDIVPISPAPFVVQLANGFAQYGLFVIRGIIRDANGTDYTIELKKNICQPADFVNGTSAGTLLQKVDCASPKIIISEVTNLAYNGKSPILLTKDGTLFYPNGTLNEVDFTFTPFEVVQVYTGGYEVKNRSTATYDLDDNVFVQVVYKSDLQFDVTCQSALVSLLCCIKDYEDIYLSDPNSARGRNAKIQLDKITIPFLTAVIKEKAGQDASIETSLISSILKCDCDCNQLVEAAPVAGSTAANITIVGLGATNVSSTQSGNTTQYTVSSKSTTVTKDPSELGFSIQIIQTQYNTEYRVTLNPNPLANEILTAINNDQALTLFLQQIVGATGGSTSLIGLDGKCVIEIGDCTYTLIESTSIAKTINSITINNIIHNAPAGLLLTNVSGITSWLNGLALGSFTATFDGGSSTVTIKSISNPNPATQFAMTSQGSPLLRQFSKTCAGLVEVLNAIITYICALQANEIAFGYTGANLCTFGSGSTVITTPVLPGTKLDALLVSILNAQCALYNNIGNAGLNCAAIKAIFPTSANAFISTDGVYGTRNDACNKITFLDLATVLLSTISGNATLKTAFCAIVASCTAPSCSAPSNVSGVLTTGPVCVAITNITATAS